MFISSILATSFYILVQQYSLPNTNFEGEYKKTGIFEYNQIYDMYSQRFNFDDLDDVRDYYYDIELHYVDNTGDYLVARGGIENMDSDTPYELPFSYTNNFQSNLKFVLTIKDGSIYTSHTFDTMKNVMDEYEYELSLTNWYVDFDLEITYSLYPQYVYEDVLDGSYSDGYQSGYTEGYDTGKQDGISEGQQTGYDDGYQHGYSTGHTQGYSDGYNTALTGHSFSFTNLFASISDTPILMIRRLFGFEIFGTSVMAIFMSLFTALIVIKVIKRVF